MDHGEVDLNEDASVSTSNFNELSDTVEAVNELNRYSNMVHDVVNEMLFKKIPILKLNDFTNC